MPCWCSPTARPTWWWASTFGPVKLDLQARGVCRELALEFLTRPDLYRYLALEFPGHCFPEEFAALVHARTEGSPLFMADLLRYLRDRQVLTLEQGRWTLRESVPDLQRDLPESVRGMIQRMIDQLGEDDRRLLVAASVQGYEFDSAVVARYSSGMRRRWRSGWTSWTASMPSCGWCGSRSFPTGR